MQPKINRQRGVTWMEVLFVFALLVVLVVIFVSVFSKARERSGPITSGCESREKLLSLGFTQYLQDNDFRWPPGMALTGSARPSGLGWAGQINSYLRSPIQFRCPYEDQDNNDGNEPPQCYVSYGYNVHIAQGKGLPFLPSPDRTVLLFEVSHVIANMTLPAEGAAQGATTFSAAGDGTGAGLHSTFRGNDPVKYATGHIGGQPVHQPDQFEEGRHQKRAYYLFADGHVKLLAPEAVSVGGSTASNMVTFSVK